MLNHKGEVAECTGDNIFLVRRGILLTPPREAGIFAGTLMRARHSLALKLDMSLGSHATASLKRKVTLSTARAPAFIIRPGSTAMPAKTANLRARS